MKDINSRTVPAAITVVVLAVSLWCTACGPEIGVVHAPPANGITALEPASAVVGSGDLIVKVRGSGFDGGGVVQSSAIWVSGGTSIGLQSELISSSELQVLVPASLLRAKGRAFVYVLLYDAAKAAFVVSNRLEFLVRAPPPPPPPEITALDPASVVEGSGDLTVRILGTELEGGVAVWVDAQSITPLETSAVSKTELTALVPRALLGQGGTYAIRVGVDGSRWSADLTFTVECRYVDPRSGECSFPPEHPVLLQLDPSSVTAGHGDLTVRLSGSGLVDHYSWHVEAVVNWSGTVERQLLPTASSDSELTVTVPADLLTSPSSASLRVELVDVQDWDAVYARSNALPFTVLP